MDAGVFEGAYRFLAAVAAKIVLRRCGRAPDKSAYGFRIPCPRRAERMRTIRERNQQVHLGAEVDSVAGAQPLAAPDEAPGVVGLDRREETYARWDIAGCQSKLRRCQHEIVTRVARRRRIVFPDVARPGAAAG